MDNLWRIHQNREKKGLGATNSSLQMYEEGAGHNQDNAFVINNGVHLSMRSIIMGERSDMMYDNALVRFN